MQESKIKRGEHLFQEGDQLTSLYVIKQGKIKTYIDRAGHRVEIATLGASSVLGEQALFGNPRPNYSAVADSQVNYLEIPLALIEQQLKSTPAGVKLVTKSIADEIKNLRNFVRSIKMEQDTAPCPQMAIPKMFAILNLLGRRVGAQVEGSEGSMKLDWGTVRINTSRLFLDSPQRMQGVLELLSKLNRCEMIFKKDDDGIEQLTDFIIHDFQFLEDFSEFYQYNLYKGGKAEVIYVDPLAFKVARGFVELSQDAEKDFRGSVRLDYNQLKDNLKKQYKIDLKETHINILEKKGLFVKRQATDDGVYLSFDKDEFQQIFSYWQVIYEIDKWNEKGYVDLNEKSGEEGQAEGDACPECNTAVAAEHKFCPNCGHRLENAA